MNYWHEPRSDKRTLVIYSQSGRLQACARFSIEKKSEFQIFAKIWEKDEEPQVWHVAPEGWIELWPYVPVKATNLVEAQRLQKALLTKLGKEIPADEFEPIQPDRKRIEIVSNPDTQYQAWIYAYFDGRYEVQYYGYHKGRAEAWTQIRYETRTFTHSLTDAKEVALIELEQLKTG